MEFFRSVKNFYYDLNSATLSGAIDVIVVRHPDGTLHGSPFHVRFGKLNILRTRERVVSIKVNGKPVDLQMKLGAAGECFFVNKRPDGDSQLAGDILTSPIPSPRDRSRSGSPQPPAPAFAFQPGPDATLDFAGDTPSPVPEDGPTPTVPSARETPGGTPTNSPHRPPKKADSADEGEWPPEMEEGALLSDGEEGEQDEIVEWTWGALPVPDHLPVSRSRKGSNEAQQRMPWMSELGRSLHRGSPSYDHHRGRRGMPPSPLDGVYLRDLDPQLRDVDPDNISFHSTNEEFFLDQLSEGAPSVGTRTPGHHTPAGALPSSPDLGSDANSPHAFTDVPFPAADPSYPPGGRAGDDHGQPLDIPTAPHSHSMRYGAGVDGGAGHMMSQSAPLKGPMDAPHHLTERTLEQFARSLPDHHSIDMLGPGGDHLSGLRRRDIEISLCGTLSQDADLDALGSEFDKHAVHFEEFEANPMLLSHPNLVVRIHGKYLNWATAAPIIMSFVLFNQPLSADAVDKLLADNIPKTKSRSWWFGGWSRGKSVSESESVDTVVPDRRERQNSDPKAPRTVPEPEPEPEPEPMPEPEPPLSPSTKKGYFKALRLTSDQLKLLNLKDGKNIMEFSVVSKIQGRAKVQCQVFLWPHDAKIIISDIDGTITKSDVLGHAAALVGRDWTHVGVASLYTHCAANGYRLLYLSSRSISQGPATRMYINGVKQDEYTLPEGPILLSPTSLMRSFHNEVILKVSDRFKTACLRDVLHLFPKGSSYYAGFGNRTTDINAYQQVGVRSPRIFIINPHGQVQVPTSAYRTSYSKLDDMVDVLFPPISARAATDTSFNSFEYWQSSVPEMTDEDLAALEAQL